MRATEPDLVIVPCMDPAKPACVLSSDCRLRSVLHQARAAFLDVLDRYALADLVANRPVLAGLLDRAGADAMSEVPGVT